MIFGTLPSDTFPIFGDWGEPRTQKFAQRSLIQIKQKSQTINFIEGTISSRVKYQIELLTRQSFRIYYRMTSHTSN